jgi:hypothetical protein
VYYSPPGRAEAVLGFINAATDDEPTQIGIVWNEQAFVFTEAKVYKIIGETEPFAAREVYGCPGTRWPETVKITPYGVAYRAADGPRLFTGAVSQPFDIEPVKTLFRGFQAFDFNVAAYKSNEYFMSDGITTLAHDLEQKAWRDLGVGCAAMFIEDDTNELIVSFASKVLIFETNGASNDDGSGVAFNVEFNGQITVSHNKRYLRMLYFDLTIPAGQTVTPYLVVENPNGGDTTINLTPLIGATGTRKLYEVPIAQSGTIISVGLTSTITGVLSINSASLDVYDAEAAA